jgi:hypothetical protein
VYHFHTKAQAPTTAPAESFSSTVLHKYRLLFCRAATFTSSGETIASYLAVGAPFSYQSSSFTNCSSGVLSEVRTLGSGSVAFFIPKYRYTPAILTSADRFTST